MLDRAAGHPLMLGYMGKGYKRVVQSCRVNVMSVWFLIAIFEIMGQVVKTAQLQLKVLV